MPRSLTPSRSRSRPLSSRSRTRSPYSDRSPSPPPKGPRTPHLIRMFVTKGRHAPLADFDAGLFPTRDEFQVYAWQTSTPSELIKLLYPSFPAPYRSPQTRFHFRHVYVDASPRGLYRFKDLTSFIGRDLQSGSNDDSMDLDEDRELGRRGRKIEEKSLDDYGFVTGDFLSVSINVPEPRHPVNSLAAGALAGIAGNSSAGPAGLRDREGPRGGFGWGDRGGDRERPQRAVAPSSAPGEGSDATRWGRGVPLPPQDRTGPRGGRGGYERASLPEGRWNRGDDRNGPSGPARDRSRSPRRDRRESWSRRRD